MDLDSTFRLNERDVIAESIDGEVLIINLNTGVYFSAEGTGDEIWRALLQGLSLRQVIERLGACYAPDSVSIAEETLGFVETLRREDLLVESDAAVAPDGATSAKANGTRVAFRPPVLNRYTDFEELLKLDPIHEVHQTAGWPVARPADLPGP